MWGPRDHEKERLAEQWENRTSTKGRRIRSAISISHWAVEEREGDAESCRV